MLGKLSQRFVQNSKGVLCPFENGKAGGKHLRGKHLKFLKTIYPSLTFLFWCSQEAANKLIAVKGNNQDAPAPPMVQEAEDAQAEPVEVQEADDAQAEPVEVHKAVVQVLVHVVKPKTK